MQVLIVDDEPIILEQAKTFLKKETEEMTVDTTTNVQGAFEMLEEGEYDAIISDYKMPDQNGIEFLEKLRKKGIYLPFIILTGKGDEETAMKALNRGADRYFQKGGDHKTLFKMLAKSLERIVEHKRIKEREDELYSVLTEDLQKKIEESYENLKSLQEKEFPEEEKKKLESAMEKMQEGKEMIEEVTSVKKELVSRMRTLKRIIEEV